METLTTNLQDTYRRALDYLQDGQLPRAEQAFQAVLGQEPAHIEALNYLSLIAFKKSDWNSAIEYLTRAAALDPEDSALWNNIGVVHNAAVNHQEAKSALDKAIELRPDYPEAWNNLGIALHHLGREEDAARCFRQAMALKPDYPEAHNNLGLSMNAMGRYSQAMTAFEQALQLKPNFAEAFENIGLTLSEQGQFEKAVDFYRKALKLKPHNARISNNLATAFKEQGLIDEAITQYRDTLEIQPNYVLALWNLSQFVAEGLYNFSVEEWQRVQQLLASHTCSHQDQSQLCFTLANVLDKQGCYEEAFAYYREANENRREHLRKCGITFDAKRHAECVDRIIAGFSADYFRKARDWGTPTRLPVYIIGMPRSGSTLVEQILCSHPQVFGAGEIGELPRRIMDLAGVTSQTELYSSGPLFTDQDAVRSFAKAYLDDVKKLCPEADRITIKTLENVFHLGVLAALFPEVRVIHCRRHPLDVGLSCYFQNFRNYIFAWTLEDIGVYYREYERLMEHWQKVLPITMLQVDYEELVSNQEAITRKLLSFCDLDWNDRCLAFFENRRHVRTASTLQVRQPLYRKSVHRWKRYQAHLEPLIRAMGKTTIPSEPEVSA